MLDAILACCALLGFVLTGRHFPLPFGYLPFVTLALLSVGGFAAVLGGFWVPFKQGAVLLGLGLLLLQLLRCLVFLQRGKSAISLSLFQGALSAQERLRLWAHNLGTWTHLPVVLFGLFLLLLPWYYDGVTLRYYDEFYWGSLLKDMLHTGGLLTQSSLLYATDISMFNPPGTALLAAFFMPDTMYEPGIAVAGMTLLLALGCVVMHVTHPTLGMGRAFILALLCCCLARCVGTLHRGIYLVGYADYFQAVVFAALLIVTVFERQFRLRLAVLLPGLALLCLIKATGFLFALGVVAVAVTIRITEENKKSRAALCWRMLGVTLLLLLPVALTKLPWDWHIQAHLPPLVGTPLLGQSMLDLGMPNKTDFYMQSFRALLWAFYGRPLLLSPLVPSSAMSVVSSTLAFVVHLSCLYWLLRRCERHDAPGIAGQAGWQGTTKPEAEGSAKGAWHQCRRACGQSWVLFLLLSGLLGWMGVRFLVSVMIHTPAEALRAASFERYVGAYVAGCAVLVLVIFHMRLVALGQSWLGRFSWPLLTGQCLVLLLLCGALPPWPLPGSIEAGAPRADMSRASALLQAHTPPDSRIWFINQNTDYHNLWALRYLLAPQRLVGLPPGSWSLGQPYHAKDRYSRLLKASNILPLIRHYNIDFMLLWHIDARFCQEYGSTLGLTAPICQDNQTEAAQTKVYPRAPLLPLLLDVRAWRDGTQQGPLIVIR